MEKISSDVCHKKLYDMDFPDGPQDWEVMKTWGFCVARKNEKVTCRYQGCPIVRNSSFRIPQDPQNPPFSRDFDQKECQFTSSQHRYFTLVGVFINKS